jgi:hypothetical protein
LPAATIIGALGLRDRCSNKGQDCGKTDDAHNYSVAITLGDYYDLCSNQGAMQMGRQSGQ